MVKIGKWHAKRLRTIYNSAGWPYLDTIEIELLAAGMAERIPSENGLETIRVTDAGFKFIALHIEQNRQAFSKHQVLVEKVAQQMLLKRRIVWCNLPLRAQILDIQTNKIKWCMSKPDVFSIRNTSVETYVEPIVHEIKVSRTDFLGDIKNPKKRAAYCNLGQCWYVLGRNKQGDLIAQPEEVPLECGVIGISNMEKLEVIRHPPMRPWQKLPFHVWLALAKAIPTSWPKDDNQYSLI